MSKWAGVRPPSDLNCPRVSLHITHRFTINSLGTQQWASRQTDRQTECKSVSIRCEIRGVERMLPVRSILVCSGLMSETQKNVSYHREGSRSCLPWVLHSNSTTDPPALVWSGAEISFTKLLLLLFILQPQLPLNVFLYYRNPVLKYRAKTNNNSEMEGCMKYTPNLYHYV